MASLSPTYEYQADGSVHAVFEGRVIAKEADFDTAVKSAVDYLDSLSTHRTAAASAEAERTATHVQTPNGLKGQIISRVDGMWGNEITVRFSNNEIRRFETTAGLTFSAEEEEEPDNVADALQTVVDRSVEPTKEAMTARVAELEKVKLEVHNHFAAERNPAVQRQLNQISMEASAELGEIRDHLAHLEDVDARNESPAAPVYAAVEQASFGPGASDDWLEITARQMIAESEAEDMETLLNEGPTKLVSSLDDAAVHVAGTVHEIAANYVMGKTAGFEGPEVEAYREAFVAKAEAARRTELSYRQDNAREEAIQKEASTESVPDEGLFL